MSDTPTTIDTYLDAYGEPNPSRRRELIIKSWASGGTLADPPMQATGHAALDEMFAAVQGQFPGHRFRRTSAIDEHHNVARYSWDLVSPDGTVTVAGLDIAHLGSNGELTGVTGFFGPLPPLEA